MLNFNNWKKLDINKLSPEQRESVGKLLDKLSKEKVQFKILKDKWGMSAEDAIKDQLARFGITGYVFMSSVYGSKVLPSGVKIVSMGFIGSDGNAHNVLLTWNPDKKAPDGSMGYYELASYDASNKGNGSVPWLNSVNNESVPEYDPDSGKFIPWIEGQPVPTMRNSQEDKRIRREPWYIRSRELFFLPVTKDQEDAINNYFARHPGDQDWIKNMKRILTTRNELFDEQS